MSRKIRIVKEKNRYYPEYYHKSIFGKMFSGWRRFESDELWLNGIYTELKKCELSFTTKKLANKFLNETT